MGFERDSWVTPVDARRVEPEEDANRVAAEQVRAHLHRLPDRDDGPIFVFDAGYDPVRLPQGERRRKPKVLWLWWNGAGAPDLDLIWRSYCRRFSVEHGIRFLKQALGWTTPRVRYPEQADRWTWLVLAAYAQLRLAKGLVADRRLPWEKPLPTEKLTPPGDQGPLSSKPRGQGGYSG